MIKVVAVTLGFDEKFAIRGLLRIGLNSGDRVLVFTAIPIDDRVERALNVLREFVSRYYDDVTFKVVDLDVKDFYGAVLKAGSVLKDEITSVENVEVVFNFSGGMRSLILEVLVAAVILGINGQVEVELENFAGVIGFPLKVLKSIAPLSNEFKDILHVLVNAGELNLSRLAKRLNIAKSTVHLRVKRLVELNLVETEYRGRNLICKPTRLAKLFV